MRFRMKADIVFYAEDINDAMKQLANHFAKQGDTRLIDQGEVSIEPEGGT